MRQHGVQPNRADMKTQYYTATRLDGFIATDDHSLEWLFALVSVDSPLLERFCALE